MPDKTWKKIKTELGENIPQHAINTWFEPIRPIILSKNELVVEVPNQFFYEWIESHYKQVIRKATERVSKNGLYVRLTVSDKEQKIEEQEEQDRTTLKENPVSPQLNKGYTFESFIEGANNQFAKSATQAVAEAPGKQAFNPLII